MRVIAQEGKNGKDLKAWFEYIRIAFRTLRKAHYVILTGINRTGIKNSKFIHTIGYKYIIDDNKIKIIDRFWSRKERKK